MNAGPSNNGRSKKGPRIVASKSQANSPTNRANSSKKSILQRIVASKSKSGRNKNPWRKNVLDTGEPFWWRSRGFEVRLQDPRASKSKLRHDKEAFSAARIARIKARRRGSSAQNFAHFMPAQCNYNHLSTMVKPLDLTFLKNDDVIQKRFFVQVTSKSNSNWPNFSDANFTIREVSKRDPFFNPDKDKDTWRKWPISNEKNPALVRGSSILAHPNANKLYIVFVGAYHPEGNHAAAGIVHKHQNTIEYFILEPHGIPYRFHFQIARRYFQPDVFHMPFAGVQGQNKICKSHTLALLHRFLREYKADGNRALVRFRTPRGVKFSTAPILNKEMGEPLGRHKTFRITESNPRNLTSSKAPRLSSRSRTVPL